MRNSILALAAVVSAIAQNDAVLPAEGHEVSSTERAVAVAWRGKTLRLTGWLRVDGASQNEMARLWIRVVRPNHSAGLLDNLTSEPVRGRGWELREVSMPVPDDALTVEYGVLSSGDAPITYRNLSLGTGATIAPPQNLDFSRGLDSWNIEPNTAGAAAATSTDCMRGPKCAVLSAPASLVQTFGAAGWRGQTVRLRTWVRFEGQDDARIWMRSEAREQHTWYRTLRDPGWTQIEIARTIEDDADGVSIGFTLFGTGHLWIEPVSMELAPASEALPELTLPDHTLPRFSPVVPSASVTSSGPPFAEQQKIINQAAARAAAYLKGLPDFVCTQTVRRSENRKVWKVKDVLTVQLGYTDGTEHYKLTAIDGHPTKASYRSMVGAISEGDFGSILGEIFAPGNAQFSWNGEVVIRDRPAYIFDYHVAKEKSQYQIHFGTKRDEASTVTVPHHGSVYIDRETGEILRLMQVGEMPAGFPVTASTTLLDYEFSEIGGRRYLLPLRSAIEMETSDVQVRNETQFGDYRKFGADAKITFEPQ